MDNPALDIAILELLEEKTPSEFELIKALQSPPYELFNEHIFENDLSLFQTHFIVYNALFRLRDIGLEHKIFDLDILATKISKLDISKHKTQNLTNAINTDLTSSNAPETKKLREYYLNWDNFHSTNEDDVNDLLTSFWDKMSNRFSHSYNNHGQIIDEDQIDEALYTLGLTSLSDQTNLKKHYKKLCVIHHPDKGGEPKDFQRILLAYQLLVNLVKPSNL